MKKRAYILLSVVGMMLMMFFFGTTAAHAQGQATVNNGNGLRVSPVRQDATVEPGKSLTVDVNVENITDSPAELRVIVNDFVASGDESCKPSILFDEDDYAPSHGLRRYVAPISNIKLAPKERKTVKVTINMPADAAGGGYYGAVRFLPSSAAGDTNVSLTASVGSLLLVSVPGDVKEQLGVESMNVSRGDDGKASSFFTNGDQLKTVVRFKNSGNIQQSPFGKVVLKKSGKEVASYEINNTEPRGSILPDSIRRFEVGFGDKAKSLGKYTVEGNFGYGNQGQLITSSTSFYVVPLPFVIIAIALLILIIFLAFAAPRMLKNHDRRLLRKMRGRK